MGFYQALFDIVSSQTKNLAFATFVTRLHDIIICKDIIYCKISNFLELSG